MAGQDYRYRTFNLSAGVAQSIIATGNYWQVIKATGDISLQFDEGGAVIMPSQGLGGPAQYNRVTILSPVDQVATIGLGTLVGPAPYDGRATFSGTVNAAVNLPTVQTPLTDVSIPATSSALIAAADADRVSLLIRMPDDAADSIRVGDSSVSATKGLRLGPGDAMSIDGGAAVYAYNPDAAAVAVSLLSSTAP